jgi:hypothetical protein
MSFKAFMRTIAGLIGSLTITSAIMAVFMGLILMNIIINVEKLDEVFSESLITFIEENKEESRIIMLSMLENEGLDLSQFNKQNIQTACLNREILDPQVKQLITTELCSQEPSLNDKEIQDYILDQMITTNMDKLKEGTLPIEGSNMIKTELNKFIATFGELIYIILIGILVYLIGAFLIFVSVNLNLLRGLYRVCLKTSINLLTTTGLFILFKYIKPDTLLGLIGRSEQLVQGADISKVPPEMLKLLIQVILDWLRLSTDPLIIISLIASIPFIIITIIILVKRLKDKGEMTGKEQNTLPNEEIV